MMQDSLAQALGALKVTHMDDVAAHQVRARLDQAWATSATQRRSRFAVPVFVRVIGVATLAVLIAFATMHAAADSPLYGARVAIENSLVSFQSDPVAYLTRLYDERLEEAAHFEATGNALAASRARGAQSDALRLLNQISPEPGESPEPSASTAITLPSPSPTPDATAVATESPTPEATSTPTPRPTVARTATPKPATAKPTATPTPKPLTPKPSPTPTPSPMTVHATGDVLYADGSPVNGACVSTTLDGATCIAVSVNGKVDVTLSARKGQSITLYFRNHYDATSAGTLRGKVTVTVGGPEVMLGTITLR